jgi:hypothetical protein
MIPVNQIDSLIAKLREGGSDLWISGPQPEDAIRELELELGVEMPPSYRTFLAQYGGLSIGDWFISGIIDGDAIGEATGWLYADTMRFRDEFGIPESLLVVQPDEDAPFCLDVRNRSSDGECPVVCYELHSGHAGRIAETFREWLLQGLQFRSG